MTDPFRHTSTGQNSTNPELQSARHKCPRCVDCGLVAAPLHAAFEPTKRILECDSCGGVFVGTEPLQDYLQNARVGIIPVEEPTIGADHLLSTDAYLPCPVCEERMNRKNFGLASGVMVDVCKQHGTWFDRGELSAALTFAASPAFEAASARRLAEDAERRASVRRPSTPPVAYSMRRSAHTTTVEAELATEILAIVVNWLRR